MKRWRLALLLVLGTILCAAALGFRLFYFPRPVGRGPAGPPVPREPFTHAWTTRPVLLLALGDSVTAGFGVPQAYSYVGRLAANPRDEFPEMQGISLGAVFPQLRVENLAISGSTSIAHLEVFERDLKPQPRETLGIVVMTTGGNDLIHDYGRSPPREGAMFGATLAQARPWIENFEKRLARMLDTLNDRFPGGCHVFLADIYDPTDGVADAWLAGLPRWPDGLEILAAYNQIIHRTADQRPNVHVVPMHQAFLGHGIHCAHFWRKLYHPEDPTYWYGGNFEDPNLRGYDALRRLFLLEMIKVTPELRK